MIQPTVTAVWKTVVGYDGVYEVSDLGQVRSVDRIDASGHRRSGVLRKLSPDRAGYLQVHLSGKGKRATRKIHQLVLEAFVGPKPPGMQCRHLNGIKTDNRLVNLCWGTKEDNALDKVQHGVHKGERNTKCKLTSNQVVKIRELLRRSVLQSEIAQRFDVSVSTVSHISAGYTWRHI